jgi:hypothetical protein
MKKENKEFIKSTAIVMGILWGLAGLAFLSVKILDEAGLLYT